MSKFILGYCCCVIILNCVSEGCRRDISNQEWDGILQPSEENQKNSDSENKEEYFDSNSSTKLRNFQPVNQNLNFGNLDRNVGSSVSPPNYFGEPNSQLINQDLKLEHPKNNEAQRNLKRDVSLLKQKIKSWNPTILKHAIYVKLFDKEAKFCNSTDKNTKCKVVDVERDKSLSVKLYYEKKQDAHLWTEELSNGWQCRIGYCGLDNYQECIPPMDYPVRKTEREAWTDCFGAPSISVYLNEEYNLFMCMHQ